MTNFSLKKSFALSKSTMVRSVGTRPSNWSLQVCAATRDAIKERAKERREESIFAGTCPKE